MALGWYIDEYGEMPESLQLLLENPLDSRPEAMMLKCPATGNMYLYGKPTDPEVFKYLSLKNHNIDESRAIVIVSDQFGNHPDGFNALYSDGRVQFLSGEEFKKEVAWMVNSSKQEPQTDGFNNDTPLPDATTHPKQQSEGKKGTDTIK